MRGIKIIVGILGVVISIGLYALNYVGRFNSTDSDVPWLASLLLGQKGVLATSVFTLSLCSVGLDGLRNYLGARHDTKNVVEKLLNSYAKTLFADRAMSNRLTLFKYSRGWRVFLWALIKLKFFPLREQWPRIREVLGIKWTAYYLGVYLRPKNSWNRVSTAAFRVSNDAPDLCEGIVGRIWRENGLVEVTGLDHVDRALILAVKGVTIESLPVADPVRRYAEATGVKSVQSLLARTHLARHFVGTVIENAGGERWGVLLLDSGDDECPAIGDGTSEFQQRFRDCALILGKVVE
ncbi:hypothetical protein ACFPN2_08405 [Steroidobacter flavus]|uniref:Uncharacterized protein n=1 Tax=Steroidobacter flavus TaxID=1842136 RepID=A0ABV8SNP1_9GAMM